MKKGRHKLTEEDLAKRTGNRRQMVLEALLSASGQHRENPDIVPALTPEELAKAWKVHPTSTYRCLQRLWKAGCVVRTGFGVTAEYSITEKGQEKLEWLRENPKS